MDPCGTTHDDAEGTWSTRVDDATFHAMLKRAAAHSGYSARQRDAVEYRVGPDTLLRFTLQPKDDAPSPLGAQVSRTALVGARRMGLGGEGRRSASMLVRTYRSEHVPFSSFPCDANVQSAMRVRRLELRVHARARLVFEVKQPVDASAKRDCKGILGVRLEIDVSAAAVDGSSSEMQDLRRTVENTIHVVFMGLPRLVRSRLQKTT